MEGGKKARRGTERSSTNIGIFCILIATGHLHYTVDYNSY